MLTFVTFTLRKKQTQVACLDNQQFLRERLIETVRYHLVADVDVGLFLSAGIDSSVILALASEANGKPIQTFTLGFAEFEGTELNESPLALRVAEHYGAKHHPIRLSRDDFVEARADFLSAMDQPTIDGLNTFLVSRAARKAGLKVALSGLGADELFGGYRTFAAISKDSCNPGSTTFTRLDAKVCGRISTNQSETFFSSQAFGLFSGPRTFVASYSLQRALYLNFELSQFLPRSSIDEGLRELAPYLYADDPLMGIDSEKDRVSFLEMTRYMRSQLLRDADWAGMANSLEIRVPFVDYFLAKEVLQYCHQTGTSFSKQDLVAAPRIKLPSAVINRKKTGFNVPIVKWLNPDASSAFQLRDWACEVYSFSVGSAEEFKVDLHAESFFGFWYAT